MCVLLYILKEAPQNKVGKITSCIGSGPPIFFYDVFLDALNIYAQGVTQLDNLTGCEKWGIYSISPDFFIECNGAWFQFLKGCFSSS